MSQRMSQKRQSQGPKSSVNTVDGNTKSSAERAVFWILAHGTHQAPIKHTDLKKYVFPDTRVEEPLKLAKEMLNNTFGYDLVELPGKAKMYVLVNKMGQQDHITKNEKTEATHVLLAIVLGYIFMSRQPVEQQQLKKFLEKLDINVERGHPYFGNVNDLIFKNNAAFVKDQYLEVVSDEVGTFYNLGERFKKDVNPRALLKFVSKMCGVEESSWNAQLKDIEEMEANVRS